MSDDARPGNAGFPNIIGLIFGLIELWLVAMILILLAAFTMSMLGANPDAGFATWIYGRTQEIMRPFNGLFDEIDLTGSTVIRPSLLFAMAVYGVVAAVVATIGRRLGGAL